MKPTYYIASKLENAPRVRELKAILDGLGWQHTYDWTAHGSIQSRELPFISQAEVDGVKAANVVIVLLPGGRGTHVELGVAIACNKRITLVSADPDVDFGFDRRTCAFYHYPNIEQTTWEVLLTRLGSL